MSKLTLTMGTMAILVGGCDLTSPESSITQGIEETRGEPDTDATTGNERPRAIVNLALCDGAALLEIEELGGELTSFFRGPGDCEATIRIQGLAESEMTATRMYEAAVGRPAPDDLVTAQRNAEALGDIEIAGDPPVAQGAPPKNCHYEVYGPWVHLECGDYKDQDGVPDVTHDEVEWSRKSRFVSQVIWGGAPGVDHTNTVYLHCERLVGYGDYKTVGPHEHASLSVFGFKGWRTINLFNPYDPGRFQYWTSGAAD